MTSFITQQRSKEIGIRKVLGAEVTSIVSMLSFDFLKPIMIAIVIAVPISWYLMNRWLEDFAYRIHIGAWMLTAGALIAVIIALATISFQAIKAAVANPVKSLRTE